MYENDYQKKNRFSFGENWKRFLNSLTPERIDKAQESLIGFLGSRDSIKNKQFLDVGCGSGLFSLAAYRLGANKVVSFDTDRYSVSCAKHLFSKEGSPINWQILQGSVLDQKFINKLGKFDVVYSWGVLHHTGNMYQAIGNVTHLVKPGGYLYLAIYNRATTAFYGGTSLFWLKIKKIYNSSNSFGKRIMEYVYILYHVTGLILFGTNPITYIREYKKNRGMDWKTDVVDWLGGYPYEFASPDEIINWMGKRNFLCKNLVYRNGTGCNEYLFVDKN
ncbi:MAG: class I SAM-dependent methyltransferase [Desulfobacteraceae bacterium]|jgi:2-polyprenyl-6-hydroxyphenyl methylase/3-demethylubiquinone-9 3-methyltransferase